MAKKRRFQLLPTGALLALLWGAVIVPAVLSLAVGIIALALWRQAFDVVFGVLILSFAAMAITGGILAMAFLRRSARLAELQTDFVAAVSHELRTPLAGIRLLGETLAMGRAREPSQQQNVLRRLLAEVDHLETLVDQVLGWRRFEAGENVFLFAPLTIPTLVDEALRSFALDDPSSAVRLEMAPDLPEIEGDKAALIVALRNLIDNARKFAGADQPMTISAVRKRDGILVAVRDQGPGLTANACKHIFERFYRVDGYRYPGTGLGLSIVKRVVEGHQGWVRVESMPGQGATFSVFLPIQPAKRHVP